MTRRHRVPHFAVPETYHILRGRLRFMVSGDEQRERFLKDGYVVLESFFDETSIASVRREADALRARTDVAHPDNLRCRWQTHPQTGAPLLDALDPILDLSPAVERIARAPKLLELLAEILEEPAFLFKDKLIYKPSGAPGHALHQDFVSWPRFPESFTTVLVAIDPAGEENGCLSVYRGAHGKGYLSPRDGDYHDLPESRFRVEDRVPLKLRPGDAAVFGCFLPHGSRANRSASERRHLYLSYNGLSDGGDRRTAHYNEFHTWLRKRYAEYGCVNLFFK